MDQNDKQKKELIRQLKKANAFWSYKSSAIKDVPDDVLVELVMLHLDLDDINILFEIFPYKLHANFRFMVKLTIFTPTYNRAHTLPDLYNSLCKQTCQDFEWLVVDDGSTDGTDELVRAWLNEGKFDIRLFYLENAGKMMAHNKAVEEAKGLLFMCLDSDDYLCSERVVEECLRFWEDNVHSDKERNDICGFIAYKRFDGIKCLFPKEMEICHFQELFDSGFKGETSLVLKRDILSRYPYPYYEGEKFVTDIFVYDQIDQDYRFFTFPIRCATMQIL